MNQRRDFQEADMQSFYSGRKIRRVVEQSKNQEESHVEENHHEEYPSSSVPKRENRIIQQAHQESIPRMNQTNNQTADDPQIKLVRSLERNLADSNQRHLIAVFGMNSDVTITNALRELDNSMYGDFIVLQRSNLICDVYTMFASAMLNFVESNANGMRWLDNDVKRQQVLMYLQDIHSSDYEHEYENGLVMLDMLNQKHVRGEKCKELVLYIKQQMNQRNLKFIWNIEVGIGELNYNLLNNLSKIANENLIVIVNTLGSLELEVSSIGSQTGNSACHSQAGYQILHKYIWFEDIIQDN